VTARVLPLGATGKQVALNVAQIRKARGLSLRSLSRAMEDAGWLLSADSLNKIELGVRRVDVDELVALAAVFEVEPSVLLAPITISTQVVSAVSGAGGPT
jgi:transcriptional regulator with XRE-family HTH domain